MYVHHFYLRFLQFIPFLTPITVIHLSLSKLIYPFQKYSKSAIKSNRLFYRMRNNFESTLGGYWEKRYLAWTRFEKRATCHKSCVGYVGAGFTSLREHDELFKALILKLQLETTAEGRGMVLVGGGTWHARTSHMHNCYPFKQRLFCLLLPCDIYDCHTRSKNQLGAGTARPQTSFNAQLFRFPS